MADRSHDRVEEGFFFGGELDLDRFADRRTPLGFPDLDRDAGQVPSGLPSVLQDLSSAHRTFVFIVHLDVHPPDGVVGVGQAGASGAAAADLGLQDDVLDAGNAEDGSFGLSYEGVGFGGGQVAPGPNGDSRSHRVAVGKEHHAATELTVREVDAAQYDCHDDQGQPRHVDTRCPAVAHRPR